MNEPGLVTIHATLSPTSGVGRVLQRDEPILVIDPQPASLRGTIACGGDADSLILALKQQFNSEAVALSPGLGKLSTILLMTGGNGPENWSDSSSDAEISNTSDANLYKQQMWGQTGPIKTWRNLASGKVTVKLYMAESYQNAAGQRLFDIAINGKTVENRFDIFAAAEGKNRALVKTYEVDAPNGKSSGSASRTLKPTMLHSRQSNCGTHRAKLCAQSFGPARIPMRLVTYGRRSCSKAATSGKLTLPRQSSGHAATARGSCCLLAVDRMPKKSPPASPKKNLVNYAGPVGPSGPSWMGFWFFGRNHWLLDGLPSNCVLDWPYQISEGNGLMLSGPGVEAVIGYGRNHDPNIGIATATIRCGRGEIVLLALAARADGFIYHRKCQWISSGNGTETDVQCAIPRILIWKSEGRFTTPLRLIDYELENHPRMVGNYPADDDRSRECSER